MSAIIGIYNRDACLAQGTDLAAMLVALAHRGPDGTSQWRDGPVGLGHCMLQTTPEARYEHLPLTWPDAGVTITADARLDNRFELIAGLRMHDRPTELITDSELILAAYRRWGERCVEHLLGDFTFAIWDSRTQTIFCARDHFGVLPFYYYLSSQLFIFATEIRALFCLPQVPRMISELAVAEYLTGMFGAADSTFYQEIRRLPPAHTLSVCADGVQLRRYWMLDPERELCLSTDKAYADAFRAIFTTAVHSRLRSSGDVGTLLSGGLDSSAITCVARERLIRMGSQARLPTFSAIFDAVPECDERPYINAVLAQGGLEPHYIHGDQSGPLRHIERLVWHIEEPFLAPGLFLSWLLYQSIAERGLRVLLDGDDGDGVVSHGDGHLIELARTGRWLPLAWELYQASRVTGESFPSLLMRFAWRFRLRSVAIQSRMLAPARQLWRSGVGLIPRRVAPTAPPWQGLLDADFAARTHIVERWQQQREQQRHVPKTERGRHYAELTDLRKVRALEVINKTSAAFGIEPRHAFWDRRLVEFCLALPAQQKLRDGYGRLVMRQALASVLPESVAWRRTKAEFLPNLIYGLKTFDQGALNHLILHDPTTIEPYVQMPFLRNSYQQLLASKATGAGFHNVMNLWRLTILDCWLRGTNVGRGQAFTSTDLRLHHS